MCHCYPVREQLKNIFRIEYVVFHAYSISIVSCLYVYNYEKGKKMNTPDREKDNFIMLLDCLIYLSKVKVLISAKFNYEFSKF